MNSLQLTEEETEELLKQAYIINRKLKQEIREQDDDIHRGYASALASSAKSHRLPPIGSGKKCYTSDAHDRAQHIVSTCILMFYR